MLIAPSYKHIIFTWDNNGIIDKHDTAEIIKCLHNAQLDLMRQSRKICEMNDFTESLRYLSIYFPSRSKRHSNYAVNCKIVKKNFFTASK